MTYFVGASLRGRPAFSRRGQYGAPTEGRPYKLGHYNTGSADALAQIEREAGTIIRAWFLLGLRVLRIAFADEGVRAPGIKSPCQLRIEFWQDASAGQVVAFLTVLCDIQARNLCFRTDAHADHQINKLQNDQRTD